MYRFRELRSCLQLSWPLAALLVLLSLALAGFFALARDVWRQETIPFDAVIMTSLSNLAGPGQTAFMRAVTNSASVAFVALFLIMLAVWWRRQPIDALALIVSVIGGFVLNEILKAIFARPRPDLFQPLVSTIGYSFPSGHTTTAVAFFGVLAYLLGRRVPLRWRRVIYMVAAAWILLVGLSRSYLGAHYPSDVLAAYAVTLPWLAAVIFVHSCFTKTTTPLQA